MQLWTRLIYLLQRRRFDEDLDTEVRFHINARVEELSRGGMPESAARNQALREFGNAALSLEESRDPWTWQALDRTWIALRQGFRTLRLNPGFIVVAISSLALGIGANTAIFQLLNAVRLRALPVARPQELVEIKIPGKNDGFGLNGRWNSVTYPLWEQIRDHQEPFASVFAWGMDDMMAGEGAGRHGVHGVWASGRAFETLGVKPIRGRLISAEDEQNGCSGGGVVASYGFWQREFGGRDEAIGARVVINSKPFTVIGVTPPEFYGLEVGKNFDVALPACAVGLWDPERLQQRNVFYLGVMGRLKPGWKLDRAASQLRETSRAWFEAVRPTGYSASWMERWDRYRLTAEPRPNGISQIRSRYESSLLILLGISGLVLVIACANLTNLLLARSVARAKEIAVRMAIGATRLRVIFELLAENALLAAGGAIAGTLLATVLSRALVGFLSTQRDPIDLDVTLDGRVLAFTAAVALVVCLTLGITTAIFATRRALASGQFGVRGITNDCNRFSLQRMLIVGQISISLVLLVASLLFVRSFRNLFQADAGFRQDGIMFSYIGYEHAVRSKDVAKPFRRDLLAQVRSVPGIESAAISTLMPLSNSRWTFAVEVPGTERREFSQFTWVSPQYFSTMDTPILAGRDISESDTAAGRQVIVVNETFVQTFLGGRNPLGQTVKTVDEPGYPAVVYEIVGVVKDTKYADLRDPVPPSAYGADMQHPLNDTWTIIVTRSALPTGQVSSALRKLFVSVHPEILVNATVPLRANTLDGLARDRLLAWLSGFFGGLAVLLAGIGLYGVISYMVTSRRNEIGIRLALGSTPGEVARLILRQIALMVGAGLAIGAVAALAFSGAARNLLFGLQPTDPGTFAVAAVALALIALGAGFLPARRAVKLDPIEALRQE